MLGGKSVWLPGARMRAFGKKDLPALMLCVFICGVSAQPAQTPACVVDSPTFQTNAPNIFNDQQEQDLGDALAEYAESEMHIAPPAVDDQLTRIGEKLLATLPPTEVHYRFRVYDSGEINGFSLAGGRVYISRKLIAAVKTEDELAGVLAHEIGHISTHQSAIEITRIFRVRLGVTQVTDRADIFAKVHLMMSTQAKSGEGGRREEKSEAVADHVALYAMMRAGYAAESFPSFLNQVTLNNGKTGNWLSDMFGLTPEEAQRYRAALKLIATLPEGCMGRQPGKSDAFQAWLKSTVEERVKIAAENAVGDRPLKLDPPLRPGLWMIRFSPNGRFILAQDETSIAVVDKDGAKVLFKIDAPDVQAARFTPDSGSVVFLNDKLRVERWSVATGQRTSVKEMVVFDGCNQSLLSPDGKTLVCVNFNIHDGLTRISLRLIDVESGKPFFEKPDFFGMTALSSTYSNFLFAVEAMEGVKFANFQVSPDGRYLLVVVGNRALAYDLERRQPVELGGKLKGLEQARMCFLGPDQLYVVDRYKQKDLYPARILSFPDGRVLRETQIGDQYIRAVTKGQLLIVEPLKDYAVGVLDPDKAKFLAAWKLPAIDVWDQSIAAETAKGGLAIGRLGSQDTREVALTLGPLPALGAAAFSPDGRFLVASMRYRAEIWNLDTGKEVSAIRPMHSLWVDDANRLFGQFPKHLDHDAAEIAITLDPLNAKDLAKYEKEDRQYHDLQYRFKPLNGDKASDYRSTLEVRKMETQAVVWSRDYPHGRPVCWSAEDNRMVLGWDLSEDTAKEEIKSHPELERQAEALKNKKKGLLIETVNPKTGAPYQQVVIPEADLSKGWNDQRVAWVSGEFVLVRGEHENTVIYRLDSGAKVGEFFGAPLTTDAYTNLVAAVNREDEVLLVDERSGKELKRFTLGSPVRLARIVAGKETLLLVLTADQVVHRLALPQ
jgi:WD40 repeat protein